MLLPFCPGISGILIHSFKAVPGDRVVRFRWRIILLWLRGYSILAHQYTASMWMISDFLREATSQRPCGGFRS